jgi:tryptophan synthase beta subunit
MATKSGAQRQAALRDKGRQIAVVLRDPEAIAALDALAEQHGGVTKAVAHALVHAAALAASTCPPH